MEKCACIFVIEAGTLQGSHIKLDATDPAILFIEQSDITLQQDTSQCNMIKSD
jgi:hypothetical protein